MNETRYMPLGIGSGTLVAGRYQIDCKLGAGGMSAVFRACDRALNNEFCALKILEPRALGSVADLERFRNEVLITRKLTHPSIVRTYEFGQAEGGQYFVSMEYVEGETLHDIIYSNGSEALTFGDIRYYLLEIARGLGYAHEMGVIHRDLKPANVLISSQNEVKITDFGLAQDRNIEHRLTQVGECVGTPAYMPPEQVQGSPVDGRADIYALGIIAYEVATGHLPFEAKDWYTLASQIISQPLPRLDGRAERAPAWLSEFIAKATAKDPAQRFQNSAEVIQFLATPQAHDSRIVFDRSETIPVSERLRATVGGKLDRNAPILAIISCVLLVLIMLIGLGQRSAKEVEATVEQNTGRIKDFADTVSDLVEVAVEVQKNKQTLKEFIQEHKRSDPPPIGAEPQAAVESAEAASRTVVSTEATDTATDKSATSVQTDPPAE